MLSTDTSAVKTPDWLFQFYRPAIRANDITDYGITSRREVTGPSLEQPENTVYQSFDTAPDVVRHVHPATALWQSIPMAAARRMPNEEIRLLTEEDALEWCEKRKIEESIIVAEFSHLIDDPAAE